MAIFKEGEVVLPFFINETDLLAGTSQWLISPMEGEVVEIGVVVQKAVTTGGAITVELEGVAVSGISVTVADGAAAGTVYTDTSALNEPTRRVQDGKAIEIVPAAAFATAGAVSGWVRIVGSGKYVT